VPELRLLDACKGEWYRGKSKKGNISEPKLVGSKMKKGPLPPRREKGKVPIRSEQKVMEERIGIKGNRRGYQEPGIGDGRAKEKKSGQVAKRLKRRKPIELQDCE